MLLKTGSAQVFLLPAIKLWVRVGVLSFLDLMWSGLVELSDKKNLCSVVAGSDVSHLKCTTAKQCSRLD